eukprot:RCo037421
MTLPRGGYGTIAPVVPSASSDGMSKAEGLPSSPFPPYHVPGGDAAGVGEESPLLRQRRAKEDRALSKLTRAALVCFSFMCVEFVGGVLAHSLAVMTDATHLLSDIVSFLISIAAIMISRQASTAKMSFGFHRVEILGATFSIFMIWVLTLYLVYTAVVRLIERDSAVNGKIMLITATFGLIANILMAFVLGHGHGHGHSHGQ